MAKNKRISKIQKNPQHNSEMETLLGKEIKKLARKDKTKYLITNFREDEKSNPKQKWDTINKTRKGYTARKAKLKNPNGKIVPMEERAEVFAQYFADKVWNTIDAQPNDFPPKENIYVQPGQIEQIKMWELNKALKKK